MYLLKIRLRSACKFGRCRRKMREGAKIPAPHLPPANRRITEMCDELDTFTDPLTATLSVSSTMENLLQHHTFLTTFLPFSGAVIHGFLCYSFGILNILSIFMVAFFRYLNTCLPHLGKHFSYDFALSPPPIYKMDVLSSLSKLQMQFLFKEL